MIVVICSPETARWMRNRVRVVREVEIEIGPDAWQAGFELQGGYTVVPSHFAPTWGPRPVWWRRWFLGEKPNRHLFQIDTNDFQ